MIVDITGKIRSVHMDEGLRPYLYYTVLCTDVRDIKTKLSTKFQLRFDDDMVLQFKSNINEFYHVDLLSIDSTGRKNFILEWLKLCSETKGFYLEKKYASSSIIKSFPNKIESKFVRLSSDNFDMLSTSVIAFSKW